MKHLNPSCLHRITLSIAKLIKSSICDHSNDCQELHLLFRKRRFTRQAGDINPTTIVTSGQRNPGDGVFQESTLPTAKVNLAPTPCARGHNGFHKCIRNFTVCCIPGSGFASLKHEHSWSCEALFECVN